MCVHGCRNICSGKNIAIPKAELPELLKFPMSKDKIWIMPIEQVGAGNGELSQEEGVKKNASKEGGKKQGKIRLRINALFECHR